MGGFLETRIAIIHTASEWPCVARGAMAADVLPGAGLASIEWPRRSRRAGDKIADFECRGEQRVPVFGEPAAAAAQPADRPERRDFSIDAIVESAQLRIRAGFV
jgi:hypothetical protein